MSGLPTRVLSGTLAYYEQVIALMKPHCELLTPN